MAGKKKKAKHAQAALKDLAQPGGGSSKPGKKQLMREKAREQVVVVNDVRRAKKLEKRRQEKNAITAEMWALPVPSHLVAKLEVPKIKTKHKTYFEIADNHEKKKKLEYTVTDDRNPPPGFAFVAVGDPDLTKECKELSRERDAMIFIVSDSKEEHSKIAEHVHRAGYHFREYIVEDARQKLGATVISKAAVAPGFIEPIPELQKDINDQADKAIIDLFPRIPNTDRAMIISHAFKKGGTFQGEPTVGMQADIPLSRRVQLATLAHIRHVHTRYDLLLRETTWMNARKAVEPVCLDILLKWRGDEETGRDQMDEILREVVVITDSEGEEESSDDDDDDDDDDEYEDESSDEEGEVTSSSSMEGSVEIVSSSEPRTRQLQRQTSTGNRASQSMIEAPNPARVLPTRTKGRDNGPRDKNSQKGFKRYQAAYDDAKNRQKNPSTASSQFQGRVSSADMINGRPKSTTNFAAHSVQPLTNGEFRPQRPFDYNSNEVHFSRAQSGQHYSQPRPTSTNMLRRDEVIMRPLSENSPYSQNPLPYLRASSRPPQVVGGSPVKHGLQDLLVPSIETGPTNFPSPSHVVERSGFRTEREMDVYPRRANEHGRISPVGRQVIVLDDDSPQAKRRRVVFEDSGHPGAAASLSRPYMQPERFESPRLRASAQPGEFLASHSRATPQLAQGLFQSTPGQWQRPVGAGQLPVYDAPESGFFATHPRQLGMQEVEYRAPSNYGGEPRVERQNGTAMPRRDNSDNGNRSLNEPHRAFMAVAEPYPGGYQAPDYRPNGTVGQRSPNFPAVDQAFVHSFSQSRLGNVSGDGFDAPYERAAPPSFSNQAIPQQRYEDSSLRSFSNQSIQQQRFEPSIRSSAAPPLRPRSPVQYIERPMQYRNERQDHFYDQRPETHSPIGNSPRRVQGRQGQNTELPTFVRTIDPNRRNVIILD